MEVKKISEFVWEIPKQGKMLVPAIIFASDKLMEKIKQDKTLEQSANVACLKGIIKASYTMPDAHQGYGFPIGGVAAFDLDEGIISPGGVGYDINCGVRLLRTNWNFNQIKDKRKELLKEFTRVIPPGVGEDGMVRLSKDQLLDLLAKGGEWALENNYASKEDLNKTEEYGRMKSADPTLISDTALKRGRPQIGTLGAGNHFLELQRVGDIYDEKAAKAFGITDSDQLVVMIHCGSRGLGHQTASDYIKLMDTKFGHDHLPDRELVCAPINSDLGRNYYSAMCAAINYAFVNRQMITYWARNVFEKVMGSSDGVDVVYDVCHNIAKFEKHKVDGVMRNVCVHRKGATRSFGSGRQEIPEVYRNIGQPVIIPGSMGTSSFLLLGTSTAEDLSWGSTAHGAGRVTSRTFAMKNFNLDDIKNYMAKKDIEINASSKAGILEECHLAYKDVDEVIKVSHEIGIGKKVARLIPIGVMKG